jgi:hypothetical protein
MSQSNAKLADGQKLYNKDQGWYQWDRDEKKITLLSNGVEESRFIL